MDKLSFSLNHFQEATHFLNEGGIEKLASQKKSEVNVYFDQIYHETNRSVTLFLISKCKNLEDVNDILQEVYMEYYQVLTRKGLHYIKKSESFLISLCRKKIASYYSFWDRIPHKLYIDEKESYEREALLFDVNAEEETFDDEFFRKEIYDDVKKILSKQPEDIQKIFYMYYTMELRIPEIAKILHIKAHNVKNKLFHTRKMIRGQLEDNWR